MLNEAGFLKLCFTLTALILIGISKPAVHRYPFLLA